MKVYLAGPMRNVPQFNFPAFFAAAEELRSHGHEVFNPAEADIEHHGVDISIGNETGCEEQAAREHGLTMRDALLRDISYLIGDADAIALLPGWENSRGAKAELAVAYALGLQVIYLPGAQKSILEEALSLTTGDRQASYGHPLDDFSRTAGMISAMLSHKLKDDVVAEDVPLIMECVKISREVNNPKRDNRTDGAGYWNTLQMVHDERERRSRNE